MKMLVSTPRYILFVDLSTGAVTPICSDRPEYYGISWSPIDGALLLIHSGMERAPLADLASYAGSERGVISRNGTVISPPLLSAPHQMVCGSNGWVICANTGRNCVTIFDPATGFWRDLRISAPYWDRFAPGAEDLSGDHLNSVHERDGKLFVVAHRFDKGSRIAEFSYPGLELTRIHDVAPRTGLHNIWITDDGRMISCDSAGGTLVDLVTGENLWDPGSPCYLRGLAATEDTVLVGESEPAGRVLRPGSLGGLWVIDRKTWRTRDYLPLGPHGGVNEVRILDHADQAHHGVPFPHPESLLRHSTWQSLREARLSGSERRRTARASLGPFSAIGGDPLPVGQEWLSTFADQLCYAIAPDSTAARGVALAYRFDDVANAARHVSAVIGYRGGGRDANMVAVLLQPAGPAIGLDLWVHDGTSWSRAAGHVARDLPLCGHFSVTKDDGCLVVRVDDREVARFPSGGLTVEGDVGARWYNSSIKDLLLT